MSHSLIEDSELLARSVRGDEAAFRALYERHRVAIYRFAYRMCGGGADDAASAAEDVTHDCFIGLIKNPHGFDPQRANLRAYLYGTARHLAIKRRRRREADASLEEIGDQLPAGDERGDEHDQLGRLLEKELSQIVERAVCALPPLQREALMLFEYEELSLAEIAEIVGADVGTIKARLWRARQSLRATLTPYLAGGAAQQQQQREELVSSEGHGNSHARPRE